MPWLARWLRPAASGGVVPVTPAVGTRGWSVNPVFYFALRDRPRLVNPGTPAGSIRAIRTPPEHRPIQSGPGTFPKERSAIRRRDIERGDVQIGRHRRKWLIHASSTATVPSASRVAVGEGWISRTGVASRGRHSTGPRVVRISTRRQMNRAMFRSNGTSAGGLSTPRPRRRSPGRRVAVGEGWISRTGVPIERTPFHRTRRRTNQLGQAIE